jgi:hypothetical protein
MAISTAAAIIGGSVLGAYSASEAADAQSEAAAQSTAMQGQISSQQMALQREQFERQLELQKPWREAGEQALNKLIPLSDYQKFGMDQYKEDPGYAFRLAEGQKALDRQAAARGGLISGGALKAATRYGQEMGSQEYTNAFNRYQTERAAQLQPLQSLAGVGQTAAQTLGNAGQTMTAGMTGALGNYGNAASEAYGAAGQARASGYMGMANAASGGLGQYLNYQQNQSNNALLQQVLNRNSDPRAEYSGQGPFGYSP